MKEKFTNLEKYLNKIIGKYEVKSDYFENTMFMEVLGFCDWMNGEEFTKIKKILSELIENNNFTYYEEIGSSITAVNLDDIAKILVKEAKNSGVKITLDNLQKFLLKEKLDLYRVCLLGGIYTESSDDDVNFIFENNVQIVKIKNFINKRVYSLFQRQSISCPGLEMYLIYKYEEEKKNVILNEKQFLDTLNSKNYSHIDTKMNNVYLCLLLARRYEWNYIPMIAKTVVSDGKDFIVNTSSYELAAYFQPKLGPGLIQIELHKANEILKKFEKLDIDLQNKLSIAIKKLSEFSTRNDEVDKAISVRVSMESIFLNDNDREELSSKLRLRASTFLGGSSKEKKRIKNIFCEAYDVSSSAVHNGKIQDDKFQKIEEVVPYLYKAINKIIDLRQEPHWVDYELK